jgi:hypothetical protein
MVMISERPAEAEDPGRPQPLGGRPDHRQVRPPRISAPSSSAPQRGSNDAVATELNDRPRKTLGWKTPAERLRKLLATTRQ